MSSGGANDPLLDGSAWALFCDRLKAVGSMIDRANPGAGERVLAEGYDYLLGMVGAGIRQAVDLGDADHPRFFRNPDGRSKWGAENADNLYLWARIRPDATYRISGTRSTAFDFLVEVKEGYMQLGQTRNFATLSAGDLTVASNGSFEIVLSPEPRPGNWLPLDPDARYVTIRQYFADWENEEPATFRIEREGGEGLAPAPRSAQAMSQVLDGAARWTEASVAYWQRWVDELRSVYRPDRLAAARKYQGGADAVYYGNDFWQLDADQALVIESELPQARYWGFQLCDLWFRSLDYANHQTSINMRQACVDADGRFRCVVAHRDPGVPNWLDTTGHGAGIIQYRWIWSETNPAAAVQRVDFDAVREALPSDTPTVTPDRRRRTIAVRQAHVARREPST